MELNDFPEATQAIVFEDKSFQSLMLFLSQSDYSKLVILVDSNTTFHCLPLIDAVFNSINLNYELLTIKAGEENKTLESCIHLWEELSRLKVDRQGLLINLGGGMITDLGGFVAATYKRGIDFLNIPTSLLAMTDAAIGGKCGIDFLQFKNQIGVFQLAELTLIFPEFLNTLSEVERKSGLAESIKHALIADAKLFKELKETLANSNSLSQSLLEKSIEIKTILVAEDPLEKGNRKKLNFGHTIGHALESYFLEMQKPIPHGFAIAAGIICESYISKQINQLKEEDFQSIHQLIQEVYKLPSLERSIIPTLLKYIANDKKNLNQETQFTLLNGIGDSVINQVVNEDLIKESLNFYCGD